MAIRRITTSEYYPNVWYETGQTRNRKLVPHICALPGVDLSWRCGLGRTAV